MQNKIQRKIKCGKSRKLTYLKPSFYVFTFLRYAYEFRSASLNSATIFRFLESDRLMSDTY